MNAERKSIRSRIFGIGILLMMAVLAVCTVTFTVVAEEDNGSYSLIIRKAFSFNEDVPEAAREEVKEKAENIEYTFKIAGTRISNGETVKVEETFVLPRMVDGQPVWESKVYKSDGPFNVTVTELTDNVDIEDSKGNHYNMWDSSTDTSVKINSRKHELQLKNNSILNIERPGNSGGPERLWYRVTNRPYDEHPTGNFEALDMTFSLAEGESHIIKTMPSGNALCAAIYTIEQIAAPEGYQLQLGTRTETVTGGNQGHFHINGTPGRLTLTAGGTQGDGATHLFTIERTETESGDTSEFVTRNQRIASGEKYVFDNLPKGGYTVTEYSFTGDANTGFSVTMPQTTSKTMTGMSSAPQYTNFRSFTLTEGTTYFKLDKFGPLYDVKKKKITDSSITYELDYGWGDEDGYISWVSVSGQKKASSTYTMNGAKRYPKTPKIAFRTRKVSSSAAKYLGVSWIEYYEKDVPKDCPKAGTQYKNLKVDDRGWMTITAPAAKEGVDMSHIFYYYVLRDSDDNLITGVGGETDKPDTTTVMLKAGESVKLEGLDAGSYKITETVEWHRVGFTMEIEGYPFGTTETGKGINVQVGGQRDLTISKPAVSNLPDGTADEREYEFYVSGYGLSENVKIKAGESTTITLPKDGQYTITPQGDKLEEYGLKYMDSGAIYGTASGSDGDITFTNVFSRGEYGYRYVHEYYVRDANGAYTYEGNSHITTRLGREGSERFQAADLKYVPEYEGNSYKHFDEAYGRVDPIASEASVQENLTRESLENADDDEKTEVPGDDTSDPTDGEETEAPGDDTSDPTDGEETETPGDDTSDPTDGEETEAPGDDTSDPTDGEETEMPGDDASDPTDGEETEMPSDDASDPTGDGETASENLGKGILTCADGTAIDFSVEDSTGPDDGEGTETPGEDGTGSGDEEGTETPGEDGTGPDDGEGTETPGEDGTGSGDEEGAETPGEDGTGSGDEEGTETPSEDDAGSGDGEETETPGEDSMGSEDETGSPEEDGLKPDEGETKISEKNSRKTFDRQLFSTSYDDTGIIDKGVGLDSKGEPLNYEPESDKDHIIVTRTADQIIILRYFREKQPEGRYNVIHVYYNRDENGDHWEGTSGIRPQNGELGIKYTGKQIERETSFKPEGSPQPYEYIWDGRPQYGVIEEADNTGSYDPDKDKFEFAGDGKVYRPNNAWTAVEGTEEGNQIIILRYYREPAKEGLYNIVHEYYLREKGGADTSGNGTSAQASDGDIETGEENEDIPDTFHGTLNKSDGFAYTYEGGYTGMQHIIAPLDSTHTAAEDDWKTEYGGNTYTYIDAGYGNKSISGQNYDYSCNPDQQWAAATEEGDEIIILRYYRKAGYKFVHEYYVRNEKDAEPVLVGKSDIRSVTDVTDEIHYTQENVIREPDFQGDTYTYFDCGYGVVSQAGEGYSEDSEKQYVEATASEEQIIILRYVLDKTSENPEEPPENPEDPPENPEDPPENPEDPPENPEKPSKDPTPPAEAPPYEDPELPERLFSPQSSDTSTALLVPLAVNVPEQAAVTEGSVPKTGDENRTVLWMILTAGALCGLVVLSLRSYYDRKRKGQQTDQQ